MPNHVRSKITMKNIAKKDIFSIECIDSKGEKEEYMDFQKILPMPEELNIEDGGKTLWGILAYLAACAKGINEYLCPSIKYIGKNYVNQLIVSNLPINPLNLPSDEKLEEVAKQFNITVHELEEFGRQCLENARKYGAVTWYDWRCEHWGCKWNSYDLYVADDDTIFISTPWAPPEGIFIKLSKDNPYDPIYVQYANEDPAIGGYLEYLDGELIEEEEYPYESEESVANYAELWGYNYIENQECYDYEECVPAFSYDLLECKGEDKNE